MTNEQLTGLPAGIEKDSQDHADWLMQERVLVIAPWPWMPNWHEVGATVLEKDKYDRVAMIHIPGRGQFFEKFDSVKDYPHLFRPLHWWEGRTPAQMPEYIKYVSLTTRKTVFNKVDKWYFFEEGQAPAYDHKFNNLTGDIYLPATRVEWEAFQSHQSQLKQQK